MSIEKKKIGTQFTRALFDTQTINVENRTIDVVFATESEVMRNTWDGLIIEILSCDSASVRMQRINTGAPLLDTHDRYSVTNQLGVVEKAWIENNECRATIRFSKRADAEDVWQDVIDKVVCGISVGYNVYKYEITERADNTIPIYKAIDWEPTEISLVPVPADYKSGVRSDGQQDLHEVIINNSNNKNSNKMTVAEKATRKADILSATRAAKLDDAFAQTLIDDESITIDGARAAIIAKLGETIPQTAPAAPVNEQAVRTAATKDARELSKNILHAVRAAGLSLEFGETLVNDEAITLDGARAAIITELAKKQSAAQTRGANSATFVPVADEVDKKRTGMENAILHRVAPREVKAEDAGEFRGMSLIDLGRECLEIAGNNTRGMSYREIAMASLNLSNGARQHSTSDFPLILGNTINRTLRKAYELAPRSFMPFCNAGSAKDFRTMSRTQLSDFVSLDEVKEGGEYKQGTIGEGAESYKVAKYGKIINVTWETLVNDDLNAFSRLPQAMAASAAQKQSDIVYGILTANANMADGNPLFDATNHGNYTSSGTVINVANLGVARALFRKQTAPKGGKLNLTPKYLIVSPDLEAVALQYTSQQYVSAKSSDINIWAGMLTPIVDARLTGNSWYLAADPSVIDTIECAFLDGEELFTEQRTGFDVDGMELKVRMVFGAKAIDWRGLYKNVGA